MASTQQLFRPSYSERFTCCTLTIQYIICSTVGMSIASISDLGEHIHQGTKRRGKYDASVYGPPYRTIYITYNLILAYNHSTLTQPCCSHGQILYHACCVNVWISPKIELLYDVMVMRLGVLSSSHTKPHMQMKANLAAAGSLHTP